MNIELVKKYTLVVSWTLIISFLTISLIGVTYSPLTDWSAKIVNRNYNGEGLIETIEALCWLSASFIYAKVTAKIFTLKTEKLSKLVILFFIPFCFVAFGEEISWGQHIFNFETPESVMAINRQREFNFHNLNISKILGLSNDNFVYNYLRNFTTVLNPIFYLICVLIWVISPLTKKIISNNKLINSFPEPLLGTIIFCGTNSLIYLVIDKFYFDVGEIYELSLALTALMSSLDASLKMDPKVSFLQEP